MVTDIAVVVNQSNLKANRKDPMEMVSNFNLYIEAFINFLTVTDNNATNHKKKKDLLKALEEQI